MTGAVGSAPMLSRIVGGLGRSMMTAGTLILLFVGYQLWGTAIHEAREQNKLDDQFTEQLAEANSAPATTTPTSTSTTAPTTATTVPGSITPVEVEPGSGPAPVDLELPEYGDAVAKIELPTIGVARTVVEGDTTEQLSRGPGHYQQSPLPGQAGNVAISGHRTTYGQPFHNVDKLEPGDQILTETIQGKFVYSVTGLEIVGPNEVSVLEDKGDNRLTLVACHPKYSLAQRIIVHAELEGEAAPDIIGQAEAREEIVDTGGNGLDEEAASLDPSLSGQPTSNTPAILWGLACAGIWLATWLVQTLIRRRTQHQRDARPSRGTRLLAWTPYSVGLPVFLVALYFFFENFARFLPGNY